MQMVILCGGLATRLGDIAKNTPKSMIDIQGKPFLEHQIEQLKKHQVKDIVLCVDYLSEKIETYFGNGKKFDVNIQYSHDGDKPLGPIGALKKAEPFLNDVFFTMYGDSYVFVDYKKAYNQFIKQDKLAMMIAYQNYDKYDKSNLVIKNGKMIQYGGKKTKDMNYIDYGVSIFRKNILEQIPSNTFFSTKDLYTNLVEKEQLLAFEVSKRFYHIGNPESLEELRKYIETKKG
jgi:NDP-sugar pyrophosphorylase family protein